MIHKKDLPLCGFPLVLFLYGITVHGIGVFTLIQESGTLWSWWVHVSMLCLDCLVVITLMFFPLMGAAVAMAALLLYVLSQPVYFFLGLSNPGTNTIIASLCALIGASLCFRFLLKQSAQRK